MKPINNYGFSDHSIVVWNGIICHYKAIKEICDVDSVAYANSHEQDIFCNLNYKR